MDRILAVLALLVPAPRRAPVRRRRRTQKLPDLGQQKPDDWGSGGKVRWAKMKAARGRVHPCGLGGGGNEARREAAGEGPRYMPTYNPPPAAGLRRVPCVFVSGPNNHDVTLSTDGVPPADRLRAV